MRRVMLRMLTLEGGETTRRRVPESELVYPTPEESARVEQVVDRLVEARLLVKGRLETGEPYVELAHDFLVRGWDKLQDWKKQEQQNQILQRQLTSVAVDWYNQHPKPLHSNTTPHDWLKPLKQLMEQFEQRGQRAGLLWNANPRLDLLKQALNSTDNWLNQVEAEFVRHSICKKNKDNFIKQGLFVGGSLVASVLLFIVTVRWENHLLHLGKLSEGQMFVHLINKQQEAYYSRFNKFAEKIEQLNIDTKSKYYNYKIIALQQPVTVAVEAKPTIEGLNSFTGRVFIIKDKIKDKSQSTICMSKKPTKKSPILPKIENGKVHCDSNSEQKNFKEINDPNLSQPKPRVRRWIDRIIQVF